MSGDAGDRTGAIALEIRSYFVRHPDAADSAEGIRRWWLDFPDCEEPLEIITMALQKLEAEGSVIRLVADGGVVVYGRARSLA